MALTSDKADGVSCFVIIWAFSILADSQRCGAVQARRGSGGYWTCFSLWPGLS
jgi:hypothetical protein